MVMGEMEMNVELLVIGAGPAGYSAAFRAAEQGVDVALVDPFPTPGGNYLYNSSVPRLAFYTLSKNKQAHLSEIKKQTKAITKQIGSNLADRVTQAGILYLQGSAQFESSSAVRITGADINKLRFKQAIVATGSNPTQLSLDHSVSENSSRYIDIRSALMPEELPENLLIIGASSTGLELATIYSRLGSNVEVLEQKEDILTQLDQDLRDEYINQLTKKNITLHLGSDVRKIAEDRDKIECAYQLGQKTVSKSYYLVITALDRIACSDNLNLNITQVRLDKLDNIQVDNSMHTDDEKIYAAGSVTGGVDHVNVAIQKGRVAAENVCGIDSIFDARAIPTVLYTEPQIAWCGISQEQAVALHLETETFSYLWNNSHRPYVENSSGGITKIIADRPSGRIIGAQILGDGAEHLIGQIALAIEMGSLLEDLSLCLQPGLSIADTITETATAFLSKSR